MLNATKAVVSIAQDIRGHHGMENYLHLGQACGLGGGCAFQGLQPSDELECLRTIILISFDAGGITGSARDNVLSL